MNGKEGVTECAFVKSDVTSAAYFANPILLGREGMEKNLGLGSISDFEKKKLEEVRLNSHRHLFSYLFSDSSSADQKYKERGGVCSF